MNPPITSPLLTIRRSGDRGTANHGWLNAKFTFSLGDFHDPAHMGYRSLRVINNDTISGQLEHKDSMGNGRVIKAGEFQYMSAGSGVLIEGQLSLLGDTLSAGDSASIDHSAPGFSLEASQDTEFLLFRLA